MKDVVIEPRCGGRWYELAEDASEYPWGHVLVWEPPTRVVLTWQLTSEWRYDESFETQVEVCFEADGDETVVRFEHRGLEAYARTARDGQDMDMGDGWDFILNLFAGEAVRSGTGNSTTNLLEPGHHSA